MDDAMVTGRMPADKKRLGAKILEKAGLNASQAINLLWDRIVEEQDVDFLTQRKPEQREWESAAKFLDALHMPIDPRFEHMTRAELRLEKAQKKGWV